MKVLTRHKKQNSAHQIPFQIALVILILAGLVHGQTVDLQSVCPDLEKNPAKRADAEKTSGRKTRSENQSSFGKFGFAASRASRAGKNSGFYTSANLPGSERVSIEKSVMVSSKNVFVQLCVSEGKVKVNGWNRNEVRAFIKDGENLGFKVREKSARDNKPVWLDIVGYDPAKNYALSESVQKKSFSNCLAGESIELDVPYFADVKIEGRSGETSVDEVKTAKISVIDGDILVNNVKNSTDAHTHQGSITIRNSGGRMNVSTTTGNIIAHNTESSEIGDYFKAKTRSGAVTLQSIGQKEVDASSVSGSLNFVGSISNYGKYGFSTTNGLINLIIPADSAFRLTAAYGGAFQSELPLEDIVKNQADSVVFLTGRAGGGGEASVTLKSYNGTIRIHKQDPKLAQIFPR